MCFWILCNLAFDFEATIVEPNNVLSLLVGGTMAIENRIVQFYRVDLKVWTPCNVGKSAFFEVCHALWDMVSNKTENPFSFQDDMYLQITLYFS